MDEKIVILIFGQKKSIDFTLVYDYYKQYDVVSDKKYRLLFYLRYLVYYLFI